jgi:hypothetical protein
MFYARIKQKQIELFCIKSPIDQFCVIEHNIQSDRGSELKVNEESLHI